MEFDLADPDDAFYFRLLQAVPQGVPVTGDRLLLESGPDWAQVMMPAEFMAELQAGR
jgi:predicted nucleic acid-binding protein